MKAVQKIVSGTLNVLYGFSLTEAEISLENPPKSEFGDFAYSCFRHAKALGKSPAIIAEEVKTALDSQKGLMNISTIGGYVNFFVDKKLFLEDVNNLSLEPKEQKNETIIVDYIGTNLGKTFHIGHMCPAILGQSVVNIHKFLGYNTIGDAHWGDWGGLFGQLITAIKLYADRNLLETRKANYIGELYAKIREAMKDDPVLEAKTRDEFLKLAQGDKENLELWEKVVGFSMEELSELLNTLNVSPDLGIGESFYEGAQLSNADKYPVLKYTMAMVVDELLQKGVIEQNEDGSVGAVFSEDSKLPSTIVRKRDGGNMYITSELACIKYRLENWKPKKIVYCVDGRQALHFKQAINIAKRAWQELENTELFHCAFGTLCINGVPFSSRSGNVLTLRKLFSEGSSRVESILTEKGQQLSPQDIENIAIGAIKYSYLGQDREKDINFDWDKALAFDGNSGPYIQYTFVRANNIVAKARDAGIYSHPELVSGSPKNGGDAKINSAGQAAEHLSSYDIDLIKQLFRFDEAVIDAATKYKPHILAQYCFSLANAFNSFYVHTPKILEEANESLRSTRLALVEKTAETLKKGFELLAIKMPSKM